MDRPDFHHMTRREIEDYLIEMSLADPSFRVRLIEEPRETLLALGLPVGDVQIKVLVEEPGSFCIVLPRVLRETEEVSPEELEQITGGNSSSASFFLGYL